MQPSTEAQGNPRSLFEWRILPVFLAFLAVAFFYQWQEGAYESEFGSHPDEAAHYVTGLMIRDYIASGLHGSPLAYADNYYKHYPKVALGNWPPVFYLLQAPWMILFGAGRAPALWLMAAITAAFSTLLFNILRNKFGRIIAATGTLIFISLPLTQKYSGMIMDEMLTGLLMFGAAIYFGRFLDNEHAADAIGFGVFASLAILTKGSGLALGLVPPLAILWTQKFAILKRPALWLSAGIVALLAGPWTWHFRDQCKSGWEEPSISWHYTSQALVYFPWKLFIALGVILTALALAGILNALFKRRTNQGQRASFVALIFSVLIFQSIIPASREARHLVSAIPAAIFFAMAGLVCLIERIDQKGKGFKNATAVACGVLLIIFFSSVLYPGDRAVWFSSLGEQPRLSPFRFSWKGYSGFGPVVERLLADSANRNDVFLISSDARGEGMFVSEVAMRDGRRPSLTIQRASKLLASSAWNGSGYKTSFGTPEAVKQELLNSPVQFIVIDNAIPNPREHNRLLRTAVEGHPELFKRIDSAPIYREGAVQSEPLAVFKVQRD